jgi:phosphatidylglycerol:prolipoprotein diacylglycerol transferase
LPLALAMVIGRFGCFTHGCCYGTPTDLPWGVNFGDGVPRHPTQIYESLFHFSMAVALFYLTVSNRLKYQRIKFYFIGYAVYRFLTEFIRPEPRDAFGLTFYQWAAIVLATGLIVQWVVDERWKRRARILVAVPVEETTRTEPT